MAYGEEGGEQPQETMQATGPILSDEIWTEHPLPFEHAGQRLYRDINFTRFLLRKLATAEESVREACATSTTFVQQILQRVNERESHLPPHLYLSSLPSGSPSRHWTALIQQLGPRMDYVQGDQIVSDIRDSFCYELAVIAEQNALFLRATVADVHRKRQEIVIPHSGNDEELRNDLNHHYSESLDDEFRDLAKSMRKIKVILVELNASIHQFHIRTREQRDEVRKALDLAHQKCPDWHKLSDERRQELAVEWTRATSDDHGIDEAVRDQGAYIKEWASIGAIMLLESHQETYRCFRAMTILREELRAFLKTTFTNTRAVIEEQERDDDIEVIAAD